MSSHEGREMGGGNSSRDAVALGEWHDYAYAHTRLENAVVLITESIGVNNHRLDEMETIIGDLKRSQLRIDSENALLVHPSRLDKVEGAVACLMARVARVRMKFHKTKQKVRRRFHRYKELVKLHRGHLIKLEDKRESRE